MLLVLTGVTLVASLSLGFVYQWTKEPIAQTRLNTQLKAIDAVLKDYHNNPVTDGFSVAVADMKDSLSFFPGKRENKIIGYAVKTFSKKGYSGDIWLMVGFDTLGIIQNIKVLQHQETPGLGSKMSDEKFLSPFLGKSPEKFSLKVKKDGGDVDALSGATISSRAFSEGVQRGYDALKQLQHGKGN